MDFSKNVLMLAVLIAAICLSPFILGSNPTIWYYCTFDKDKRNFRQRDINNLLASGFGYHACSISSREGRTQDLWGLTQGKMSWVEMCKSHLPACILQLGDWTMPTS